MHDTFRVGVTLEWPIQAQQIVTLTKWAGVSVSRSRRIALAASTVVLLVIVSIFSSAEATLLESKNITNLICSAPLREMNFTANGTWQEIEVNATGMNFGRDCAVNVNITTSLVGLPLVLVKVYRLQLFPEGSRCSDGNLTLEIQSLAKPVSGYYVCPEYTAGALYIWVGIPIRLYLYVWPSKHNRALFSAAFVVVRSINVCLQRSINNGQLPVDGEIYAFAPDFRFAEFLPQYTFCNWSSQLTVAAVNNLSALNVTVLAAPVNSSCWSLWLNDVHVSNSRTQSFAPGARVTLLYNRTRSCNTSHGEPGFTIKFFALPTLTVTLTTADPVTSVNLSAGTDFTGISTTWINTVPTISESLPGGTDLKDTSVVPVAVGSAVAAVVVFAVVLVVTVLAIRRRRIMRHHNSFYDSRDPTTSSTLDLTDTNAAWSVSKQQSEHHFVLPSRHEQSPSVTNCSIRSAVAQNIRAGNSDIEMTDNDLYSTGFSS